MTSQRHKPLKIGLALGSGGARGWAHLGVLRRLSAAGLRAHCVAGTSIGSIAGALYACGRLDAAQELAEHLDWRRAAQLFLEVGFPRSGLLTGKNFMRLLRSLLPVHTVAGLGLPYAAVATDLATERAVVLDAGNLLDAIRASIAIPGIFTPARLHGRTLVDGGLVNPLPVSVCRALGADFVIAVDINLRAPDQPRRAAPRRPAAAPALPSRSLDTLAKLLPGFPASAGAVERWLAPRQRAEEAYTIFDVLTRSFRLAENQLTRRELELNPPDLLIQPAVADLMTLEFHRGPEAIAAGAAAAEEILPQLRALGVALRP